MNAEQLGNGRAGDVCIQHTALIAQAAHGDCHHGTGHAFADTALAADHADDLFDVAQFMRGFMQILRLPAAGTILAAGAAIMGAFTH